MLRELLLDIIDRPMTIKELQAMSSLSTVDFVELVKALNELEDLGYLVIVDDKYDLAENQDVFTGKLLINKKGNGFVDVEGLEEDIFIPRRDLNHAMHLDIVLARIVHNPYDLRPEGKIVRVIERNTRSIVGTFKDGKVYPDQSVYKPVKVVETLGAVNNHKVVVEITDYYNNVLRGDITKIIGHKNDPGMDILSIVYQHDFDPEYPAEVMEQVANLPVEITEEDLKGRVNLRDELTVTIDPADAKDLDDAVSLVKVGENFKLTVSIADISYYVEEGSPLDLEAYKRSTSVYLVDRVVPMIPHKLSNLVCSLNPNLDRLVISCEMLIDNNGNVIEHQIYPAVINTNYRLAYSEANDILNNDKEKQTEYAEIVHVLFTMNKLAKVLNNKRMKRGAINFETDEVKILVDENSKPLEVKLKERFDAEKLIEEFMLIANETVAEHFHWLEYPFIYRVHDEPNQSKLSSLIKLTRMMGYQIKGTQNGVHPQTLQALLAEVKGKPAERAINTLMLRSMAKAVYSERSTGHYGLASDYYTHFTSPIRRYPDLIVHRLIRKYLFEEKIDKKTIKHYQSIMSDIAIHTSEKERDAVQAERDVQSMKTAEYMEQFVGDVFNGVVSSITSFGLFVELPNGIEGLVHVNDMRDDRYIFVPERFIMVGKRSKKVYTIGDQVKVKCINASKDDAKIDFTIITGKGGNHAKGYRKNRRQKQKS